MMLPAYADEHVKAAIVDGIRHRGMDVVTAQDRGQRRTDDEILLAAATSERRLMLSNDVDFLRIHSEWIAAGRHHAGIVFWPQERPIGTVIRLIHQYALQSPATVAADAVKFV